MKRKKLDIYDDFKLKKKLCLLGLFKNVSALDPRPAELIYVNFQPLEVVSHYRDPQLQVAENSYLFNLSTNICKS